MENSFLQFKGKRIPYEISINGDIMICVTEIAKIIGKDVSGFLRLKKTKKYVELYMDLNGIDSRSEWRKAQRYVDARIHRPEVRIMAVHGVRDHIVSGDP